MYSPFLLSSAFTYTKQCFFLTDMYNIVSTLDNKIQ